MYPPAAGAHVLATPATRRLARETGVDLNQISGTGVAGRVTRDDVLQAKGGGSNGASASLPAVGKTAALQVPKPAFVSQQGALEERVPLRGVRKKIAENIECQIVPDTAG